MSDELDQELRDQSWRRICPDITDAEIDALVRIFADVQRKPGLVWLLTAYRAGIAAGRRSK